MSDFIPAWHLGTVGFGYKQWRGVFYPEGLSTGRYLSHYSKFYSSVEIDSTFYGMPTAEQMHRWATAVSDTFSFSVKTPRQITHEARLHDAAAAMERFVTAVRALGPKLGAILIQLPPDFSPAEEKTFTTFLSSLPHDVRFAVEFRHTDWERPQTADLLREHNICWVAADYTIMPKRLHPTADFAYLRFLGRHGRYQTKTHPRRDAGADLDQWVDEITPHLTQFRQIYGYFNNDFAGYSPHTCNQFKQRWGLPTAVPEIPTQGRLF